MVTRVEIGQLREHVGQVVRICGWVQALRLQRKMQFVIVRDSSGSLQVTHRRGGADDVIEQALEGLTPQSAVAITGLVQANEIVNLGGLELMPEKVEVLSLAETPLPIDLESGPEVQQDWRFLDVRMRPQQRLVYNIQTCVEQGMREQAYAEGFTEMHTPKLMGTASESGAEVFALEYFGRKAYLAQSPQFFKQMTIGAGIERTFEIGPVFRAEPSFTSRHSTEFTGVDVEMAWIDDVTDVMEFEERMLRRAIEKVAERYGDTIRETYGVDVVVPELPFPRITMAQAREVLDKAGWTPTKDKGDLDPAGERLLSAHVREEYGHEFVFVTHYPTSVRPFYHMREADDPQVTKSFDLLWKGLEITTGAQREHRYDVLMAQAAEKGMATDPMQDYLNVFRYGTPPHGGFGLGLNRFLMVLLGLGSIRDVTFLFRGPNRLEP